MLRFTSRNSLCHGHRRLILVLHSYFSYLFNSWCVALLPLYCIVLYCIVLYSILDLPYYSSHEITNTKYYQTGTYIQLQKEKDNKFKSLVMSVSLSRIIPIAGPSIPSDTAGCWLNTVHFNVF